MAGKKQQGAVGHKRQRGKDSWELSYRQQHKTVKARSEREAERALANFIVQVDKNKYKKPSKLTVKQFVEERWIRDHVDGLAAQTAEVYKTNLKNRIIPALGHLKLDQVKPTHLLDFYANLKEDGIRQDGKPGPLSPATIQKHQHIVSSMFHCAVDWKLIEENPALSVKTVKIPKRMPVSLDKDPAIEMLKALKKESLKYKVITLLAACTGMRRGEILGIGDKTIDLDDHIIKVERAAQHTLGAVASIKDPKNESSNRSVPFPESLTPLIEELITARNKQREKCGDLWVQKIQVKDEWVENDLFFTQWNGKPMHPNSVDGWFNKFKKDNKLPDNLTFHGLRHTNITLLIKGGVDVGTVGDNAGHNQKSTTLAYDDPLPSARRKLATIIDESLDLKDIIPNLLGKDVNIYRNRKTDSNDNNCK